VGSNKPPAFQFYPQDYLASTRVAEMTLEEEGVYIRLLCYCWSAGSIPKDPERCARLAGKGCSVETATVVQRSFNEHPTDPQRLVHDRLDIERENQRKRREQAVEAGKESAKRRKTPQSAPPRFPEHPTVSNDRSTTVQQTGNPSSSSATSSAFNNYLPGHDVVIPENINTEQFREIIGRWVIYTRSNAKANGKPIEENSMEEQELWRMVGTWKVDADSLSEAVSAAIVGGWANLRKPTASRQNGGKQKLSPAFVLAVKAAQQFPQDWQRRANVLEPDVFEALKRTGTAKVATANDHELQTLNTLFDSHLKDIRSGIKTSN